MFGADALRRSAHKAGVLSHADLLATLERMKAQGTTKNADLARLLELPTPRIADIFKGGRRITVDEMKRIVEHYGLEEASLGPSAEAIEPILDALLPLAPPGRVTDQSRRALAEALSYGLGRLGSRSANSHDEGLIQEVARATAARFLATATT